MTSSNRRSIITVVVGCCYLLFVTTTNAFQPHLSRQSGTQHQAPHNQAFSCSITSLHASPLSSSATTTNTSRRDVLQKVTAASAMGLLWTTKNENAFALSTTTTTTTTTATTTTTSGLDFSTYQVIPDASAALSPTLQAVEKDSFLKRVASSKGGSLWLGEHHNSAADHNLQVEIIRKIHAVRSNNNNNNNSNLKTTAIGLEQVQLQFQPVLDNYIDGKISITEMRNQVEWDKRWMWPFEVYQPIFETARELNIPLIALNVNSEDLALVEKDGLPGLPKERMQEYIKDAPGFASFAKPQEFRTYVDYVIRPSYELHQNMGLLNYNIRGERLETEMSFRNFFSGRILWDESMASTAYKWTKENPGGLLVGLVGADHVKFRNGIPGRFSRYAPEGSDCISVMLNPTLIDTRPSGSVASTMSAMSSRNPDQITLQLRYIKDDITDLSLRSLPESTGGVLPLADYLVIG